MKTIKLKDGHPYDGHYYGAGECIHVPDDVAAAFVKCGAEAMPEGTPVSNPEACPLAEAISPRVGVASAAAALGQAGPTQAAEALNLKPAENPGLQALAAGQAAAPLAPAPKRAGKSQP